MKHKVTSKLEFSLEELDLRKWEENVDEVEIAKDPELYAKYQQRKSIFNAYYKGNLKIQEIAAQYKISRQRVTQIVNKCLSYDDKGNLNGYSALVPGKRIKQYERTKEVQIDVPGFQRGGVSGALQQLFKRNPDLEEFVIKEWLGDGELLQPIIDHTTMFIRFTGYCKKKLKLTEKDYPFNVLRQGRESLRKYCNILSKKYFQKGAEREGEKAGRLAQLDPSKDKKIIHEPLLRVEFDAHCIDLLASLKITTLFGDVIPRLLQRFWVLLIIDVATRVILSYHVCLRPQYNQLDVLQTIKKAIVPTPRRKLSVPGLEYQPTAGMPCEIKEFEWSVFKTFACDRAKANKAKSVITRLKTLIKCEIDEGLPGHPESRPYVERCFGTFATMFRKIVSTTGSSPKDPARKDPEKAAIEYEVTPDEIEDLVAVLVANYNGTPHNSIGPSPMEALRQRVCLNSNGKARFETNKFPEDQRQNASWFSARFQCEVQGGPHIGRRPYINFMGAEYTSETMAHSGDLSGQKLNVEVNLDDLRTIRCFIRGRYELFDTLTAKGGWAKTKHNFKIRQEIIALKTRKLIHYTMYDDPVMVFNDYLRTKKERKNVSHLASLKRDCVELPENLGEYEQTQDVVPISTVTIPVSGNQMKDWLSIEQGVQKVVNLLDPVSVDNDEDDPFLNKNYTL